MIVLYDFYNPIEDAIDKLEIDTIDLNYMEWKRLNFSLQDSLDTNLSKILKDINCTIVYDYGRPITTKHNRYKELLSDYIYYLNKVVNPIEYNQWIDKLLKAHVNNILFEKNNPVVPITGKKIKTKTVRRKGDKNIYIRTETHDLFNGQTIYEYENKYKKDVIRSTRSDMLEELNAKKKPKKKDKAAKFKSISFSLSFEIRNKPLK